MDCRASHILCKEDTFLLFPHEAPEGMTGTVRDRPGELRADPGGSCCQLPPFLPPPLESRRTASCEGGARTPVGLENLKTCISFLGGGKKERTLPVEGLKNISVLRLFGREKWSGGGSEKFE